MSDGSYSELRAPVPGWPYEISSSSGEVRHAKTMRPLTQRIRAGRPEVQLWNRGAVRNVRVARLVAEAFHGHQPSEKHEPMHCDGDVLNNAAYNVYWCDPPQVPLSERAIALLDYDPETGVFRWKRQASNVRAGTIAGSVSKISGYREIGIGGRLYLAHRLAWLLVHGSFPADTIDHINGDRNDNRLCNLREATKQQNNWNRGISKRNSTGYLGVCWEKQTKAFRAQCHINGLHIELGRYDTAEEAAIAYRQVANRIKGQFARIGEDG